MNEKDNVQQNMIRKQLLSENHLIQLNLIYSLIILIALGFILTAALYFQFVYNEIPCPLCLLQRVAFLGICFGVFLNLRIGYSLRHEGLTLLLTVFLLIISTRQTLLDIYPRPGHEYIGTAILGFHMPVWSIVISVLLLLIYTIRFCLFGNVYYMENISLKSYPKLKVIAVFLMWYIITLCTVNLLASFLQCGFDACHTSGYRLLQ